MASEHCIHSYEPPPLDRVYLMYSRLSRGGEAAPPRVPPLATGATARAPRVPGSRTPSVCAPLALPYLLPPPPGPLSSLRAAPSARQERRRRVRAAAARAARRVVSRWPALPLLATMVAGTRPASLQNSRYSTPIGGWSAGGQPIVTAGSGRHGADATHVAKRKRRPGAAVVFDAMARKEYVTGFHKRKQARRKEGMKQLEDAEKKEIQERKREAREAKVRSGRLSAVRPARLRLLPPADVRAPGAGSHPS